MYNRKDFENLPVFISSMSRWDGQISSASLALAKVLSRTNRVFYIDYPYSWADIWRERNLSTVKRRMPALLYRKNFLVPVKGQLPNLQGATPAPVIPNYSLSSGFLYDLTARFNNNRMAGMIKEVLKRQKIDDYIFVNSFNPSYLGKIEQYLRPALSIYHSRDAIEEVYNNGLNKENECIRNYDLSMATSRQLCRNISARNKRPVSYFPNGGDITLFKTALTIDLPKPPELQAITTPIIGYTGAICQRIDYELLAKIAAHHKDKTLVMVGPRQDKSFSSLNLDAIPNIVFTGAKTIEELPAYLRYFDCTIIPFLKNNLTAGIYPLKINEYLGAGKSVVTTSFSEDIKGFSHKVRIANNHDEFIGIIDSAILDNSLETKQSRMNEASKNSWEQRVHLFWDLAWSAYQDKLVKI
ncbi:MAG: glycosyltransferase [Chitinophagaceae bacterium]